MYYKHLWFNKRVELGHQVRKTLGEKTNKKRHIIMPPFKVSRAGMYGKFKVTVNTKRFLN